MKKIILILVLIGSVITLYFFQKENVQKNNTSNFAQHADQHEDRREINHYTCPMHPQIKSDKPGECPICHMTLVPVYKEQTIKQEKQSSPKGVLIPTGRQQLIGIQQTTVEKRTINHTLKTVGSIAYDPQLAVALREYFEIPENIPDLKKSALMRLKIMGLSETEIKKLNKNNLKDFYLPEKGQKAWVYATLYEKEISQIKPGTKAIVRYFGNQFLEGTVTSLEPIVDMNSRTFKARIEIPNLPKELSAGSFVDVEMNIPYENVLVIPREALVHTGKDTFVFVIHEGTHFEPRPISNYQEAGDFAVVHEGLTEGDVVATSGTFLIDSESKLKASLDSLEGHVH